MASLTGSHITKRGKKRSWRNFSRKYRSKLEERICDDLDKRGVRYKYEPDTFYYEFPMRRGRCAICSSSICVQRRSYTPDVKIGSTYIEIKGKFTPQNRSAMEAFLRGHPEIDLRFIFQRDNWITKKHKSRYSDWCRKHNIVFHVGTSIPEEWVNGSQ